MSLSTSKHQIKPLEVIRKLQKRTLQMSVTATPEYIQPVRYSEMFISEVDLKEKRKLYVSPEQQQQQVPLRTEKRFFRNLWIFFQKLDVVEPSIF